jgi:hypothetical protein
MKSRTILGSLVALWAAVAVSFAADANPHTGTWKLADTRSKFAPGAQRNTMVTYAQDGDMWTITVDGVDKDGKAVHNVWKGKFDGKDYPATGDSAYDSRSYKKVDAHTMEMTVKKAGKVVGTGRITVSADGKSRTVTTQGADAAFNNTAVYDKQ